MLVAKMEEGSEGRGTRQGDSTLDDAVSMDYILSLKFCKHCLIGLPAISTTLLIDVVAFCWNFLLAILSGSIRLASTMPECYQILICFRPSSVPSSLSAGQSAGCATEGAPKALDGRSRSNCVGKRAHVFEDV